VQQQLCFADVDVDHECYGMSVLWRSSREVDTGFSIVVGLAWSGEVLQTGLGQTWLYLKLTAEACAMCIPNKQMANHLQVCGLFACRALQSAALCCGCCAQQERQQPRVLLGSGFHACGCRQPGLECWLHSLFVQ
jgi:hypothetical protein